MAKKVVEKKNNTSDQDESKKNDQSCENGKVSSDWSLRFRRKSNECRRCRSLFKKIILRLV